MKKIKVLIELKHSKNLQSNFEAGMSMNSFDSEPKKKFNLDQKDLPKLATCKIDLSTSAIAIPKEIKVDFDVEKNKEKLNVYDTNIDMEFDSETSNSTFLLRGEVNEDKIGDFISEAKNEKNIVGIYSDPKIESCLICPGSPPLGTDKTVEKLLNVPKLKRCGMNGKGVKVAIVDTGVNIAYLNRKGKNPTFDNYNSWKPASSTISTGSAPVGHGTMCAYDVCIAAPECTILDIALLTTRRTGSTVMEGILSDAVIAYRHLLNIIQRTSRPGANKSLIVNNSWGMFHPSWDFPVGHPLNYSDNPNHPFNRMVKILERAGADILFAAGNCGKDCPDGRCKNVTTRAIYGANSSQYVLSVAGVDTTRKRVGYSTIGPGRLTFRKPDISGYTHFDGSGVYSADGGTSAACPVVAGVVAAIRSKIPLNSSNPVTSPSAIKNLVTSTAIDLGPTGYDLQYGYGAINSSKIADKICRPRIIDLCKRNPRLCKFILLCKRYPWLCRHYCIKYPHLCRDIRRIQPKFPPSSIVENPGTELNEFFESDRLSDCQDTIQNEHDLFQKFVNSYDSESLEYELEDEIFVEDDLNFDDLQAAYLAGLIDAQKDEPDPGTKANI